MAEEKDRTFLQDVQNALRKVADDRSLYPELFKRADSMGIDVTQIKILPTTQGRSWNDGDRVCTFEADAEIECTDSRADLDAMEERVVSAVRAVMKGNNNGMMVVYRTKIEKGGRFILKVTFDSADKFKTIVPAGSAAELNDKILSETGTGGIEVVGSLRTKVIPTYAAAVMEDMQIQEMPGQKSGVEFFKTVLGNDNMENRAFAVPAELWVVKGDINDATGKENVRLFSFEFTKGVAQMLARAYAMKHPEKTPEEQLAVTKKYFYSLWKSVQDMWNPSQKKKKYVAMYMQPMISYKPKGTEGKKMQIVYDSRAYGRGARVNCVRLGKTSSMEVEVGRGCMNTVKRGIADYSEDKSGVHAFEFEPSSVTLDDALVMGKKKTNDDMVLDENKEEKGENVQDMETEQADKEKMRQEAPDMEIDGIPVAMPPGTRSYVLPTASSLVVQLRLVQPVNNQQRSATRSKGVGLTRSNGKSRGRRTSAEEQNSDEVGNLPTPSFKAMVCNVSKGDRFRDIESLKDLDLREDTQISFGPAVATLVPCVDIQRDAGDEENEGPVDAPFTANLVRNVLQAIDLIADDITTAVAHAGGNGYKACFAEMCDNQALHFDPALADSVSKAVVLENVKDAKKQRVHFDPMASMSIKDTDGMSVDEQFESFMQEESAKILQKAAKDAEAQKKLEEAAKEELKATSAAAKAKFFEKKSAEECAQEVDSMLQSSMNSPFLEVKVDNTIASLEVKVTAHTCKDDEGEAVKEHPVDTEAFFRRMYTVPCDELIHLNLTNKGEKLVKFRPSYFKIENDGDTAEEEPQDIMELKPSELGRMKFPLQFQKDEQVYQEGWILRDQTGEFLRITFVK